VEYFRKCLKRGISIGKKLDNFLSTGNITSNTGLDLLQKSGFTVIAEKLNYLRYLSHFRGVHRGQFFTTMKTTKVRKLLPDGWGFLCPVHTPDGSPCGLLNHLAAECQIITKPEDAKSLPTTLASLGMKSIQVGLVFPRNYIPVFLNAEVIGYIPIELSHSFTEQLRFLKVEGDSNVPKHLEIVLLTSETRQFPGVYLYSDLGRMTRPVIYLRTGKTEWIGTQEQLYMEIACVPEDVTKMTTHAEISPMNMLSIIASLTPFSDFNQSPRNMYQCQMGKQTMGTPCSSYPHRVDNKMYRIQNPQIPLVRNQNQSKYRMDDYPNGANALVAVISYTGYDMEDAMIINKSSFERGFGHGSMYKTDCINLRDRGCSGYEFFANPRKRTPSGDYIHHEPSLDSDGLPFIGMRLEMGDPYVCIHDTQIDKVIVKRYKSKEPCIIDHISVVKMEASGFTQVNIKMRINRNPIIGDKFSSRHGQKGVLSKLWPVIDMPFTESGMVPDLIINPHAFPSRMTIGMLIESMAGKSACLNGLAVDATPFRFDEKNTAIDYFGEQLVKSGFNYYGNEPMYSGISGTVMQADIFYGVVYYQRLRHMVSDKFQVRSTGPNNNLTRQPVKGRKLGGGIRLGEMERDSLLAHGASFMLHDRLMNCSDAHKAFVCAACGSVISPLIKPASVDVPQARVICTYCDSAEAIRVLNLPYVYRFLTNELSAMNIRVALEVTDASRQD
jgi:DNA-directed RNA polymerase I subunit RPA2